MINSTALKNPKVEQKIRAGMARAAELSRRLQLAILRPVGVADVQNRRGDRFLRIHHHRGQPRAFRFLATDGTDLTPVVLKILRATAHD